jgi:hypothetical protein
MSVFVARFAAFLLAASMLVACIGCARTKPVATEEEALRGMQDMDSGAENAPR